MIVPSTQRIFDGSVYAIATAGQTVLATTSVGLLTSADDGLSWAATGPEGSADWRFLAAAKTKAVAASLHSAQVSVDSGMKWQPIDLPIGFTQIFAIAIDPSGEVWVGGREGVFVSSNAGKSWSTPKNLFVGAVSNIFYDDSSDRMMVTTNGNSSLVFTVQLPSKQVSFTDTGWSLRFARMVGDHIVAATLFDGIVVQPQMMVSPVTPLQASRAAVNAVAADAAHAKPE